MFQQSPTKKRKERKKNQIIFDNWILRDSTQFSSQLHSSLGLACHNSQSLTAHIFTFSWTRRRQCSIFSVNITTFFLLLRLDSSFFLLFFTFSHNQDKPDRACKQHRGDCKTGKDYQEASRFETNKIAEVNYRWVSSFITRRCGVFEASWQTIQGAWRQNQD